MLVGFAAETGDVLAEGRRKLSEKNLDLLVANRVGSPGTGFGSETNEAAILSREDADESLRGVDQGGAGPGDLRPPRAPASRTRAA